MLELKAIIKNGEVNIIIYKGLKAMATARIAET